MRADEDVPLDNITVIVLVTGSLTKLQSPHPYLHTCQFRAEKGRPVSHSIQMVQAPPTSDLWARLSLKDYVSARHSEAQGLVILKTVPVPEAFGILGSQWPASHGKLRLWVSQLLYHSPCSFQHVLSPTTRPAQPIPISLPEPICITLQAWREKHVRWHILTRLHKYRACHLMQEVVNFHMGRRFLFQDMSLVTVSSVERGSE